MRKLTDHKLTGLNEAIDIFAADLPGPGGANHEYSITIPKRTEGEDEKTDCRIKFQNGPIKEAGVNGISNESLLAILIDRMRGFQYQRTIEGEFREDVAGPYACRDNAIALMHLEDAMMRLQKRTRDRLARGVEGTSQK